MSTAASPRSEVPSGALGDILASRAERTPDSLAFTFSADGATGFERLTYLELHQRAQAVTAALAEHVRPGARALVLFEQGLDLIAAMFGCLQAGVVAVSTLPPNPRRLHRTLPRLQAVIRDADASVVLTTADRRAVVERLLEEANADRGLPWIAVDELSPGPEPGVLSPAPGDLAFLQYTSGSTSSPRGVMVTLDNLAANARVMTELWRTTPDTRAFSWVPPSHDLGMIWGVLQPVRMGYPCALIPPVTIIKRPARWLHGMSNFRATISGGPNFAYDLAVRRMTEADRDGLDLSPWSVAINGAEPVLAGTIEAFSRTFAASGFRRSAFCPSYGLAETTLLVACPSSEREPVIFEADAGALEEGVAVRGEDARVTTLVGHETAGADHHIAVVDPQTCEPVGNRRLGEIWIAGPSIASGYLNREAEAEAEFAARVSPPDGRTYLRSGDVGFLDDGELYIAGRLKDVIVLHGRNLHAHDVELCAELADERLRPHCSAVFSIAAADEEAAVALVAEVEDGPPPELSKIVAAVRKHVAGELELQLSRIALVRPGAVPKTTSGKIQRRLCRERLLRGELEPVEDWRG